MIHHALGLVWPLLSLAALASTTLSCTSTVPGPPSLVVWDANDEPPPSGYAQWVTPRLGSSPAAPLAWDTVGPRLSWDPDHGRVTPDTPAPPHASWLIVSPDPGSGDVRRHVVDLDADTCHLAWFVPYVATLRCARTVGTGDGIAHHSLQIQDATPTHAPLLPFPDPPMQRLEGWVAVRRFPAKATLRRHLLNGTVHDVVRRTYAADDARDGMAMHWSDLDTPATP